MFLRTQPAEAVITAGRECRTLRLEVSWSRSRPLKGDLGEEEMKFTALKVVLVAAAAVSSLGAAEASCASLWYRRNQIYKDAGYCFKTARAIRAFGNAGCSYDDINDVPLSVYQHAIMRDIAAQERRMGCGE
jgi:hypothetical protein